MLFIYYCYYNPQHQTTNNEFISKMENYKVDQSLSLTIPSVFPHPQWIEEEKFIDVFHRQNIGRVYKVSMIRLPADDEKKAFPMYEVFIYFSAWYDNKIAYNFQQRILGPNQEARIVYDDPSFWVVSKNTKERLSNIDKRMIRLGYQLYLNEQLLLVNEQLLLAQNDRLDTIENGRQQTGMIAKTAYNNQLIAAAEQILGQDLALTHTAMSVVESVLTGNDDDNRVMDMEIDDENHACTSVTTMQEVEDDEEAAAKEYFKKSRLHAWMY